LKDYKSVLLIKLPYCEHPTSAMQSDNFSLNLTFRPSPSLALATLCAFVDKYKSYDYRIKAVDLNIEAYETPKMPIDKSVYPRLLHDCLKDNQYDVLAISAPFIFNVTWVEDAVRIARKYRPQAKIVLGGGYPTIFPERCLKEHDINDVAIGEGESTFLHILNKYNNHIDKGYSEKFPFHGYGTINSNKEIVIVPRNGHFLDLKELPLPAWDCLNLEKYFKNSGDKILFFEGSRGCPFRCTFCSTYLVWGRNIRYKNVDNLIDEIMQIKKKFPEVVLEYQDDNKAFSKEWFKTFINKMHDHRLKINEYICLSINTLDEEIIDLLAKIGVKKIGLAIESGSSQMQRQIKKNIDFDKARKMISYIKKKNYQTEINWMIGFPNETLEQINETFNLARELKSDRNQFYITLPFPGTELFETAKKENLFNFDVNKVSNFDFRSSNFLKSKEWTYPQLQEMIYDINIELNFLYNPGLETSEGRETILRWLEDCLLLGLPEHVIALITVGYLYMKKQQYDKARKYYDRAINLLGSKSLSKIFSKYLSWDSQVISDFNNYRRKSLKP